MPVITDEFGTREVSAQELARMDAEAEERWRAFWNGLTWRPIDEYDREGRRPELLRHGHHCAFGFWGHAIGFDGPVVVEQTWRNAQDSLSEAPLDFEPTEFAAVSDEDWRVALMAD